MDSMPVLSYVYSKQPIFGLTQEWLIYRRGVHDRGSVCLPPVWDILFPLALTPDRRDRRLLVSPPEDTEINNL